MVDAIRVQRRILLALGLGSAMTSATLAACIESADGLGAPSESVSDSGPAGDRTSPFAGDVADSDAMDAAEADGATCPDNGSLQVRCLTHEDALELLACGPPVCENPLPREGGISACAGGADAGALEAQFGSDGCLPRESVTIFVGVPATSGPVKQGETCCYEYCKRGVLVCGRPFVVEGRARVAGIAARGDWQTGGSKVPTAGDVAPGSSLARRLAEAWTRDARMEHASIASFARFTLQLLAVGAPSDLVEAAQRASLDEIRHARACFRLASRFSGAEIGPSTLDVGGDATRWTLSEAVESAIHEGCVGETSAALLAEAQLAGAIDEEVRAVLSRIAWDEAVHAELAWRFVAWAVRTRPLEVHGVAREAFRAALARPIPSIDEPSAEGSDERAFGRIPSRQIGAVLESARRDVVRPCAEALLGIATLA